MKYYFEVDAQKNPQHMAKVMATLHIGLVSGKHKDIGISFPTIQNGQAEQATCVRVHGDAQALHTIKQRCEKYCNAMISDVMPIPEKVSYKVFSKKKNNLSKARLHRLLKRGSIQRKEISDYMKKMKENSGNCPVVKIFSNTTGQIYYQPIQIRDSEEGCIAGEFDCYGFSKTATVPVF